jgi:NADH-quinone oxidoreductase subunit J
MLGIAFGNAPLPAAFLAAADTARPITLSVPAAADAASALVSAPDSGVLPPVLILLMCAVAGIATVMLLPARRETPIRKLGGAVLIAAALIVAALLVRYAAHHGGGLGAYFWAFAAVALGGAVRVVTHPRPVYSALYFVLTVFASAGLFILLWAEFMAAALVLIYAGAILVTYVFVIMLASSAAPDEPGTGADDDASLATARANPGNGDGSHLAAGRSGEERIRAASLAPISEYDAVSRDPLVAAAVGFALMGVLLFVIFDRSAGLIGPRDRLGGIEGDPRDIPLTERTDGATQKLGVYLFQNHMVNLELAGLLLTVSMVGAIIIARRRVVLPEAERAAQAGAAAGRLSERAGAAGGAAGAMSAIDDDPHAIPVYGTENPRQKEYPET